MRIQRNVRIIKEGFEKKQDFCILNMETKHLSEAFVLNCEALHYLGIIFVFVALRNSSVAEGDDDIQRNCAANLEPWKRCRLSFECNYSARKRCGLTDRQTDTDGMWLCELKLFAVVSFVGGSSWVSSLGAYFEVQAMPLPSRESSF
jgi:hypothetical protein